MRAVPDVDDIRDDVDQSQKTSKDLGQKNLEYLLKHLKGAGRLLNVCTKQILKFAISNDKDLSFFNDETTFITRVLNLINSSSIDVTIGKHVYNKLL